MESARGGSARQGPETIVSELLGGEHCSQVRVAFHASPAPIRRRHSARQAGAMTPGAPTVATAIPMIRGSEARGPRQSTKQRPTIDWLQAEQVSDGLSILEMSKLERVQTERR